MPNKNPSGLNAYYDSTLVIGPGPYVPPVLTSGFQPLVFADQISGKAFVSSGILIKNDGSAPILFSRDGVAIDGRIEVSDSRVTLDSFRCKSVFLSGVGGAYRVWAW